jgi:hypothetical protein
VPDVYRYEIKKNEIAEKFGELANEDLLAENISKFFIHKEESLSFSIEYNDKYGNAFSGRDIHIFKQARKALDIAVFAGAFCLICAFIAAFYLLKKKRWRIIRNALWLGFGILAVLAGIFSALVLLPKAPSFFISRIAGEYFASKSFVHVFISESFKVVAEVAVLAICLIMFFIIASILFRLKVTLKLKERF